VHDIYVDGQHIILSLWDTAGQEEFDRLRTLSYADTHVIMLCFAVESKDSLENVREKWYDEIARHCEGILTPVRTPRESRRWKGYANSRCEIMFGGLEVRFKR